MKFDRYVVKAAGDSIRRQSDTDEPAPELKIPRQLNFNRRAINAAVAKLFRPKNQIASKGRVRVDPRLGEFDDETHSRQLAQEAMKSLRLFDEVEKTEGGFVVM